MVFGSAGGALAALARDALGFAGSPTAPAAASASATALPRPVGIVALVVADGASGGAFVVVTHRRPVVVMVGTVTADWLAFGQAGGAVGPVVARPRFLAATILAPGPAAAAFALFTVVVAARRPAVAFDPVTVPAAAATAPPSAAAATLPGTLL